MKLTGAQILWESLVREGVTDVFGYPGGAILPAYDAMLAHCAIKAQADTIYTWNARHYALCAPDVTQRLRTP